MTKGQITIPHDTRAKLGMLPYTEVDFILKKGGILTKKQRKSKRFKITRAINR